MKSLKTLSEKKSERKMNEDGYLRYQQVHTHTRTHTHTHTKIHANNLKTKKKLQKFAYFFFEKIIYAIYSNNFNTIRTRNFFVYIFSILFIVVIIDVRLIVALMVAHILHVDRHDTQDIRDQDHARVHTSIVSVLFFACLILTNEFLNSVLILILGHRRSPSPYHR